ncbi:type II secretion system minor pseudopilin GspH [Neiella sp. HB171785]|uniref:Type II secretion system protein H n=1 Tax=Neiella litorisoli TaxID=2771431 RepID=A0A8J6QMD9_9GAMM|nr:type II secretion system minor pseudopilin GspH [Neiella litorisoli]MBD1391107.1 type II secretion system minor pseudopilin GspH [Neiella litorisoli]
MNRRSVQQSGFTLIEVLIVVMIIAFVSGGMILTLSGAGPETLLEREAQRFRVAMQMASDRAMLTSEELGLMVTDDGYEFVRWNDVDWQPVANNKALMPHVVDENIGLKLELDGLPWEQESLFESDGLFEDMFAEEDEDKITPQVFVYSYGEFTDFSLAFSWKPMEDEQPPTVTVWGQADTLTIKTGEDE